MKKKLFVCSDLHSAYTPWIKTLHEAGFDENNDDHLIVVCGDLFDRMDETKEVYEFALDMIKKDKLIYVMGNHELLMQSMLDRGFALWHDKHNGTTKTYYQLLDAYADKMDVEKGPNEIVRELLQPLYDNMVNYFETKHYVFCHGFLPVVEQPDGSHKINRHWRRASRKNYENATWLNGMDMVHKGLYLKDKVIVVGHFHSSYGHSLYEDKGSEFGEDADFSPYYYEDKLIAIDSCVAHTGKINVLVLEDELLDNDKRGV
jgi:serine/threonine protein phosphatase 1